MPPRAKRTVRIGIDLMGGDNDPHDLLAAAERLSSSLDATTELVAIAHARYASSSSLSFVGVSSVIEMDDLPLKALREKKDSSLAIGLKMVQHKELDALVSCGNTGALIACAKMALKMIPGMARPALLASLPTQARPLAVLDVGANVECQADHLVQFALFGAAYQQAHGVAQPKIGLLNIGQEKTKGTQALRKAYEQLSLLAEKQLCFVGNIEGIKAFEGGLDVLVTDGFTGNIFLKTAEGVARFLLATLQKRTPSLDYGHYPGALVAGVRGIAIKCHGATSLASFTHSLLEAERLAREGFLQQVERKMATLH